jgi:hypothetical protein
VAQSGEQWLAWLAVNGRFNDVGNKEGRKKGKQTTEMFKESVRYLEDRRYSVRRKWDGLSRISRRIAAMPYSIQRSIGADLPSVESILASRIRDVDEYRVLYDDDNNGEARFLLRRCAIGERFSGAR